MKRTYRVVVDGKVVGTRQSARTYTHAVVVARIPLTEYTARWRGSKKLVDGMVVAGYAGRLDLAEKAAAAIRSGGTTKYRLPGETVTWYSFPVTDLEVLVVPVEVG